MVLLDGGIFPRFEKDCNIKKEHTFEQQAPKFGQGYIEFLICEVGFFSFSFFCFGFLLLRTSLEAIRGFAGSLDDGENMAYLKMEMKAI